MIIIDEKSIRQGHGYVTLVLNGETGELLHMAEGKKKASLESLFEKCCASDEMGVSPVEFRGMVGALVNQPKIEKTKQEIHEKAFQNRREDQDPQTAPRRGAANLRRL